MAEHWKSTPKYWCKHCGIYVKDTSFERKQHENTGKHQGNLKRFLQGIQKDSQRSEREKDRAKAEVDRLNRITGSGATTTSQHTPSPVVTKASKPASSQLGAADQKRQWAQLAEMGIAVPEHARAGMAIAGEWQTVSTREKMAVPTAEDDRLNVGVRKRRFEETEDVEEESEAVVRKGWGSATRTYPTTAANDQDLDDLLEIPALKKRIRDSNASDVKTFSEPSNDASTLPLDITIKTEDVAITASDGLQTPVLTKPTKATTTETRQLSPATESHISAVPVFRKRKTKKP